jgi:hypothetical protein
MRDSTLRQVPAELAVAIEHHRTVGVGDLPRDLHDVAAANHGLRLVVAQGVLGRLEVLFRTSFLLELRRHAVARDRDIDRHLVGRALRAAGNVDAVSGPVVRSRSKPAVEARGKRGMRLRAIVITITRWRGECYTPIASPDGTFRS